jgi:hypothetical protein
MSLTSRPDVISAPSPWRAIWRCPQPHPRPVRSFGLWQEHPAAHHRRARQGPGRCPALAGARACSPAPEARRIGLVFQDARLSPT